MSAEDFAWAAYVARWTEHHDNPSLETMQALETARATYLKSKGTK